MWRYWASRDGLADPAERQAEPAATEPIAEGIQAGDNSNQKISDGDLQPVGRGVFGSIFDQFKGKTQAAIRFLLNRGEGIAKGALHHDQIGDIDLWYGNDSAGLKKIAAKHPEVIADLQDVIDGMHIVRTSDNRIILESDTHRAVVSKMLGKEKTDNWLLSAYEKKGASGGSSDIVPEPERGMQNGTAPLQDNLSGGKDTTEIPPVQENGQKKLPRGANAEATTIDPKDLPESDHIANMADAWGEVTRVEVVGQNADGTTRVKVWFKNRPNQRGIDVNVVMGGEPQPPEPPTTPPTEPTGSSDDQRMNQVLDETLTEEPEVDKTAPDYMPMENKGGGRMSPNWEKATAEQIVNYALREDVTDSPRTLMEERVRVAQERVEKIKKERPFKGDARNAQQERKLGAWQNRLDKAEQQLAKIRQAENTLREELIARQRARGEEEIGNRQTISQLADTVSGHVDEMGLADYVAYQIGTGKSKFKWKDQAKGTGRTHGLGGHLGMGDSSAERKARRAFIDDKNGMWPEEYAELLYANMPEGLRARYDDRDVLSAVLDVMRGAGSRVGIMQDLASRWGSIETLEQRMERERDEWDRQQEEDLREQQEVDEQMRRNDVAATEGAENVVDADYADLIADAQSRLNDPNASEFERQAARTVLRMRSRDGGEVRFRHRAPNGKESNLDERQYDEVRTENFKKWFGDWELGYLYKMATDVWSGDKSQKRYDFSPSERAAARFKEILGHDVTKLVITSDTIRHIKSHHGNDESRGQINMTADDIVLLPYLIDNYDSMDLSPKYDDKLGNRAIEIRKRVNGTTIVATIERGKENEHVVTSWKYKKSDALDAQGTPGLHVRNDSDLAKVKQEIETIKKVAKNSSKIVDANGEPLVVYHQTNRKQYINRETGQNWDDLDWREREEWERRSDEEWNDAWEEQDFYTFDNRYARQSIEFPGFFFAPTEDPYHEYGERTIAAYLDIKNPAIDPEIPNAGVTDTAGKDAMDALIAQGYDGIIRTEDGVPLEYIAFRPEQIKSATENNGDFSRENADIRFRKRDESKNLFDAAKAKFGVTSDIREAGYILPDGSMLDFSGRHELMGADDSFLRGTRNSDHRDISDMSFVYDQEGNEVETGVTTDMADFIGRGAIRIDNNAGSINLSMAPTREQETVLRRLIANNDGNVWVDFGDGNNTDHYAEYNDAKATRVLGDIDRYFSEGIKPEGNLRFRLRGDASGGTADHTTALEDARRRLESADASEFERQAARAVLRAYGLGDIVAQHAKVTTPPMAE